MPKTASAALIAFLDQEDLAFFGADIYTFTLQPTGNIRYAITGITQASSAVVSYSGSPPVATGQTVQFANIPGMIQLNGQQGKITALGSGTFTVNINTTSYTAYNFSGQGTFAILNVFRACTFDRPISYGGNIYPVTRAAVSQAYTITGITQATQAVVSVSGPPFTVGDTVQFQLVSGMTQINGLHGNVTAVASGSVTVSINSSGFSAYTSGGTMTLLSVPTISRSKVSMGVGLQAAKVDVTVQADPLGMVGGQPILTAIAQGMFDNAYVTIRRCFMTYGDVHFNDDTLNPPAICNLTGSPFGTGDGTILWFAGWVGDITIETLQAKLEVRDLIYLLNRPTPKNLMGPGCWHELFDEGCTLNPLGSSSFGNFTQTGLVTSGSTTTVINTNITGTSVQISPPVSAPTLTDSGNQNVPVYVPTYYCVITYVTGIGETTASPESSITLPPQHVPYVASPPSVTGAIGWNCYIGSESGEEQLQNGSPISFGTPYHTPNIGISTSGVKPPQFATTDYWTQGLATFTSGGNAGISAFIETSNYAAGTVTLRVPLITLPIAGDGIQLVVGCDKTVQRCGGFFSNLVHLSSVPLTPVPEQGW